MNTKTDVISRIASILGRNSIDPTPILERRTTHDVVGIEPSTFDFTKSFNRLLGHMVDLEIKPVAVIVANDTGMNAVELRNASAIAEDMAVLIVSHTELGVPPSVFMV